MESHFQGLLDDDDKYRALCGAFGYLQQQEWPDLSGACYAAFGAPPPPGTSNGAGNSFSCSGSASSGGGSTKRKPDAYVDAKVSRTMFLYMRCEPLSLREPRAALCLLVCSSLTNKKPLPGRLQEAEREAAAVRS